MTARLSNIADADGPMIREESSATSSTGALVTIVKSMRTMRSIAVASFCATMLGASVVAAVPVSSSPIGGSELEGKTVFLDPGHQGPAQTENLQRQVDDGRGGTKDCQTTGMTTVDGTPEHTINWKVSELVRSSLESLGATVVTSRPDDTGWGGCVDDRARAASASGADIAVSIHADSTSATADSVEHGFHLIVPTLPIPNPAADAAQSVRGREASNLMRDSYLRAGFDAANYAGVANGLQERDDIAGPALTTVPLVFVEMGNGSNPTDAAVLTSPNGQLEHATAIATGIIDYLLGPHQPAAAAATVTPVAEPAPSAG